MHGQVRRPKPLWDIHHGLTDTDDRGDVLKPLIHAIRIQTHWMSITHQSRPPSQMSRSHEIAAEANQHTAVGPPRGVAPGLAD